METSGISQWELHGDLGVLTINNPPQNYLDEFKLVLLPDLERWTNNDSLKGMVVTGKGRHFCAGFNKEDLFNVKDEKTLINNLQDSNNVLYYLDKLPIPVVAAVKGVCFGGGLELALSCHIKVCSDKALLSFPETGIGIIPGFNGTVKLPRQIGLNHALDVVLAGKVLHADEALEMGIVDYVVPQKEVFDFSLTLLEKITVDRPVNVIHSIMKSLNNTKRLPFDAATEEETAIFAKLVLAQQKMIQDRNKNSREAY
jgi:enoyl-CoA hydratase/carnithine racemase